MLYKNDYRYYFMTIFRLNSYPLRRFVKRITRRKHRRSHGTLKSQQYCELNVAVYARNSSRKRYVNTRVLTFYHNTAGAQHTLIFFFICVLLGLFCIVRRSLQYESFATVKAKAVTWSWLQHRKPRFFSLINFRTDKRAGELQHFIADIRNNRQ